MSQTQARNVPDSACKAPSFYLIRLGMAQRRLGAFGSSCGLLPVPAHNIDDHVGGSGTVVEVDRTAAPHLDHDQVGHGQA